MARLSVAVWPSPEVNAVVSAFDRPPSPGIHWATPEQWMVKVRPLGHVDATLVPALSEALAAALRGAPTLDCVLGPETRRLDGQWLGVPVTGLDDLASVVFEATETLVPVTHPQPFAAWLVLARGKVPKSLGGRPLSATWTTTAVCLVADRSGPGNPRFEDLTVIQLG